MNILNGCHSLFLIFSIVETEDTVEKISICEEKEDSSVSSFFLFFF